MPNEKISPQQRGKRASDAGRQASVDDHPPRRVPSGPSTSDDDSGVSGIVKKSDHPEKPPLTDNG
jgi:hypothetical protein